MPAEPSSDPDALLDIPAACAFLGNISRSKLYELLAEGTIEGRRIGRSRKVLRRSLVEYVRGLPR